MLEMVRRLSQHFVLQYLQDQESSPSLFKDDNDDLLDETFQPTDNLVSSSDTVEDDDELRAIQPMQQASEHLSVTESQPAHRGKKRRKPNILVKRCCPEKMQIESPQQGDLRLSGPPSGQGAGGGARTRDRMVPAVLRADSLATVPPTPPSALKKYVSNN
ncbi:hypothetical protein PoB_007175500 [Plakobranchus ocellatus]|uniref:Uncharacterized protein n=1 Tax=Plakobranchus ocellatus TaxID=259542 RepID=A0AAV4DM79_9GAST|nr:hypothetical protein PoB_007175500 [Plakobranchus ocellatus]